MVVNTKFEIGDEVFLVYDNKVIKKNITGINVSVLGTNNDDIDETYILNYDDPKYSVKDIFKTKQELLESL